MYFIISVSKICSRAIFMNGKNMNDRIIDYLCDNPRGATSLELAKKFLKFQNPDNNMAHFAIEGILKRDNRCVLGSNSLWQAKRIKNSTNKIIIKEMPLACVYLLKNTSNSTENILHISIWSPFDMPNCLYSQWLIDSMLLPNNEQEILKSEYDTSFENRDLSIAKIVGILDSHTLVFISSRQLQCLSDYCRKSGEFLTDDVILYSQLIRANDMSVPKPLSLITCYKLLFGNEPVLGPACSYGKAFTECVSELISQMSGKGITTREDFDKQEIKQFSLAEWKDAIFSMSNIAALPQAPGVYGFKNRENKYIYIGKAKNLKRRLMRYFKYTEESPEKLLKLRKYSFDMTTYCCGSELESLLLEYRLIKKHSPILNTKMDINERKGSFTPLEDCIILLPHTNSNKCMSFWFRKKQKIVMKPFFTDLREAESLQKELEIFFFSNKLPACNTDFPEQEIAFRWVKRHLDSLSIMPVYRMGSAKEIFTALKNYWKEYPLKNF